MSRSPSDSVNPGSVRALVASAWDPSRSARNAVAHGITVVPALDHSLACRNLIRVVSCEATRPSATSVARSCSTWPLPCRVTGERSRWGTLPGGCGLCVWVVKCAAISGPRLRLNGSWVDPTRGTAPTTEDGGRAQLSQVEVPGSVDHATTVAPTRSGPHPEVEAVRSGRRVRYEPEDSPRSAVPGEWRYTP